MTRPTAGASCRASPGLPRPRGRPRAIPPSSPPARPSPPNPTALPPRPLALARTRGASRDGLARRRGRSARGGGARRAELADRPPTKAIALARPGDPREYGPKPREAAPKGPPAGRGEGERGRAALNSVR